jgi:Membrane domain of glycerophosphoryl diester phosphodiesterase
VAELSISKAWDDTRAVIARDARLLSAIALALFVLPGVVGEIATPEAPAGQLPEPGLWTILAAVAILIALAGQLAVIRLAIGSRLTVGQAIAHGARRALPYIAATLIWTLPFMIVGVVLLGRVAIEPRAVSPGISFGLLLVVCALLFFAIRMLMTSPVASAEPAGPIAIIRRSWELTRGHGWKLLGFFLLFLIAVLVSLTAVGTVAAIIARLILGGVGPMTVGGLFVALVTQIVSAAVSVVLMVMLARIYVQLSGATAEAGVPTSGT